MSLREIDWLLEPAEAQEKRADYRAGMLCALYANAHRKEGAPPIEPSDFFPSLGKPKPKEQTPEEMYAVLRAMSARKPHGRI